ncbi:MAG TPA: DUF4168 domain-containing protein [Acetobacteraceae bacterium]|nr:DUF4168 domain-containing protein [Acetobacteraceae bacterium]
MQVSDDMVAKVGAAVGQVAMIRQEYTERVQSAGDDGERDRLAEKAQQAAVKAISDQGISVSDYNEVVSAAENNPELEDRLIMAARAST